MKVVNIESKRLLKALVYGDSGSGKTTLMGSAQECEGMFPLLVLNAGGQPVSLTSLNPRPLVLEIESIQDFNHIYTWFACRQDVDQFLKVEPNAGKLVDVMISYLDNLGATSFGTLGIDSITQVQRLAMEKIVGGTMPSNPADVPTQTQIQHWGRVLALMTNLAEKFFKLPVNVVMTALTRRDEIPSMGYTLFAPFLWGQSNMEVPSHAEMVGRLMPTATVSMRDERNIEQAAKSAGVAVPFNVLYLAGGRDFIAKWQGVPDPPSLVPNPTMSKLFRYL
jgi:hypothetical protein